MRINWYDPTGGTVLLNSFSHVICWFRKMIAIADKDKIRFVGKHLNDMRNDWLVLDFNQGFGLSITYPTKTLTESRHWNNYLHARTHRILSINPTKTT